MAHLKNCLHCEKEVKIPTYRLETFKFCSRSCAALYARTEVTANCLVCNSQFHHISSRANQAKYCSRACYYKSLKTKGQTQFTCHHCEKQFFAPLSTHRKYCSKSCVNKAHKSTWSPKFTTIRKAMLSRGMINKCQNCGYQDHPEILGVHHIDRNRKNNDISNLIVLCPNCHSIEHSRHIAHGFQH